MSAEQNGRHPLAMISGSHTVAPDGRPASEQPAWRQEFPIDSAEDDFVSRRDFTKFLGLTSLAFVVGQFFIGVKSWLGRRERHAEQAIARLNEIPVGGALVFHYPRPEEPCILLRPDENTLLAFSQKCTHLACAVVPDMGTGRLLCPCHHGVFDLATGRPTAGPPRRPLPRVTLEVRDGVIFATGMEAQA